MRPSFLNSLIIAAALAGGALFCHNARGAWGSIRANNRSSPRVVAPRVEAPRIERAPAPRPAPAPVVREAERGRTEVVARNRDAALRESLEARHSGVAEERHNSLFWFHFHPGIALGVLPPGCLSLYVGGAPFFYDQGVYYQSAPSGYVVAVPPVGAIVPDLPPGAETVAVGPAVYYYAGGAFYVQVPQGFQVVPPPMGVTVSTLPPGAASVTINGAPYYQASGAYYLPNMQGGVTVYTTAQP